MRDIKESLSLRPGYHKSVATRGRINLATENFETAALDFTEAIKLCNFSDHIFKRQYETTLQDIENLARRVAMARTHYTTLGS